MKIRARLGVGLGMALGLLAGTAGALPPTTTQASQVSVRPQLSRHEATRQLVMKWGPDAAYAQGVGIYRWADSMVPLFAQADIFNLNKALSAKSYTDMVLTLAGGKAVGAGKLTNGLVPESLGAMSNDLVYTPLPSCLLVDTRAAGGIMTAGSTRSFKASGPNFTAQGGSNTSCGIPAGVNALVVNVQSVNATARGYFRLWPYGATMPAASVMSYGTTQNSQNNIVAATSLGLTEDFSVQSSADSHLVIAVLGYFAAPVATALDCTQTSDGSTLSLNTTTTSGSASSPDCPVGYARVATIPNMGGDYPNVATITPDNGAGTGFFRYYGSSSASVVVSSRCCRVPGR